jgi:branched-chain amino acid aminotransferase
MSLVPFDDRDGSIWFDGKLIPWRDAKLHVLSHAMHYAAAAFEGERAYDGKVFKSREHSERLHRSAGILGYKIPYSVDEIEKGKAEVVIPWFPYRLVGIAQVLVPGVVARFVGMTDYRKDAV